MSEQAKARVFRLERLVINSLHRAEQKLISAVTRTESAVERVVEVITGGARA